MRSLPRFVVIAGVVVLATVSLAAQANVVTGSISGRLQFSGTLDRKVRVLIKSSRGDIAYEIFADEEGNFGVDGMSLGTYTIEVASPDFTATSQTVNLELVHPVAVVRMPLEPVATERKVATTAGTIVSVGQLQAMPANARGEFDRAVKAERAGKLAEALDHYQRALKAAPNFYMAEVNCGAVLVRMGEPGAAVPHLLHAINLDAHPPFAYLNLGRIYYDARDYAQSERYLALGVNRAPHSADGELLYGATEYQLGRLADAEAALRRAQQLEPNNSQILLQLYNVYRRQNRPAEARRVLQQFIAEHPDDHRVAQVKAALKQLPQ